MNEDIQKSPARAGLDGIVVADTRISAIDGERGTLTVRGLTLQELVDGHGFEAASHLVIRGCLPTPAEAARWRAELGAARWRAAGSLGAPRTKHGMNHLIAELASLEDDPETSDLARSAAVIGTLSVASAAWLRARRGAPPETPDPDRGHVEDWLRLALARPTPERVLALERYLVTVLEHGMNASTFATRVVASTNSDLPSAVAAGVAALKGPLHGGAPGPVLDMLDAIGQPSNAERWIAHALARGRRIMGFGHRVYRVRDPRAQVLEESLARLVARSQRLELARAVEKEALRQLERVHPERGLSANVEFFTALLLEALDIPREAFSVVFATGRVVGFCAHYFEQQREGRLLRPRARYVGPAPVSPPAPPPAPVPA